MDLDGLGENLGLIVFVAIWLLSFLMRAARRGSRATGKEAGRRRWRRWAVIIGVGLMVTAVAAWNLSGDFGGQEASMLRLGALVLAGLAVVAMLVAGFARSDRPVQGELRFEPPEEWAAEIGRAEPFEPR